VHNTLSVAVRRPSLIDKGWVVCRYSRPGPVSSEKHEVTLALRWRAKWDILALGTATVLMGGYWTGAEWLVVSSR
jgi:hypothetical protein